MEAAGMEAAGPAVAGPEVPGTGTAGTEKAGSAPRWRFLISPRWLAWHAFAVVAFWGMCWLGDWQLHRAIAGNSLSWAYTFEWPLFAIMGAVFWARTIRDELRIRAGSATGSTESATGSTESATGSTESATDGAESAGTGPHDAAGTGPRRAAQASSGEPGDRDREAAAYLARLQEQVKGHGRWHGLR
jgi:hypothetical protein